MKLRAKNRIEGSKVINPEQEFDLDDAKEAQRLIDLGAAEEVKAVVAAAPVVLEPRPNARDLIIKINDCETIAAVQALIEEGEIRVTVKDAAEKRIQELTEEAKNREQETIELIEACDTIEELAALLEGETREAVIAAAEVKKAALAGK
jgi:hypothetical protein